MTTKKGGANRGRWSLDERAVAYHAEFKRIHAENEQALANFPLPEKSEETASLRGMDWFRSIGSPKYVVAPMVDHSDLAYRMLTRRYGATLVYTQMFNSGSFVLGKEYRAQNFLTCIGDRPLVVQFAGHDPQTLLQAALMVQDKCDAVDINLGCPQGIAKRGRYGAWLMEELDLLTEIVSLLAANLKIPVICKTRIYKGEGGFDRSLKLASTLVNAGASLLTIHGRTREEKGHLVKEADWETIRRLKEHFNGSTPGVPEVPFFCNGGIYDLNDVHRCLEYTKCDGVMTSEGILENPALFSNNMYYPRTEEKESADNSMDNSSPCTSEIKGREDGEKEAVGIYKNNLDLTEEYLDLCLLYPTWHYRTMRSHLQKFLFRYSQVHVEIRDLIGTGQGVEQMRAVVTRIREIQQEQVNNGLLKDSEGNDGSEIQDISKNSAIDSTYTISWYHRHQDDTRPVGLNGVPALDCLPREKEPTAKLEDLCDEEECGTIFTNLFG